MGYNIFSFLRLCTFLTLSLVVYCEDVNTLSGTLGLMDVAEHRQDMPLHITLESGFDKDFAVQDATLYSPEIVDVCLITDDFIRIQHPHNPPPYRLMKPGISNPSPIGTKIIVPNFTRSLRKVTGKIRFYRSLVKQEMTWNAEDIYQSTVRPLPGGSIELSSVDLSQRLRRKSVTIRFKCIIKKRTTLERCFWSPGLLVSTLTADDTMIEHFNRISSHFAVGESAIYIDEVHQFSLPEHSDIQAITATIVTEAELVDKPFCIYDLEVPGVTTPKPDELTANVDQLENVYNHQNNSGDTDLRKGLSNLSASENPWILNTAGSYYSDIGDIESAERVFLKAFRQDRPQTLWPLVNTNLIYLYRRSGNHVAAWLWYSKLRETWPYENKVDLGVVNTIGPTLDNALHKTEPISPVRQRSLFSPAAVYTMVPDGQLNEWDLSHSVQVFPLSKNVISHSAALVSMHDEQGLYIAVQCYDPTPLYSDCSDSSKIDSVLQSDSVQLVFRIGRKDVRVTSWYSQKTGKNNVFIDEGGKARKFSGTTQELGDGIKLAYSRNIMEGCYIQEMYIPWDIIGFQIDQRQTAIPAQVNISWGSKSYPALCFSALEESGNNAVGNISLIKDETTPTTLSGAVKSILQKHTSPISTLIYQSNGKLYSSDRSGNCLQWNLSPEQSSDTPSAKCLYNSVDAMDSVSAVSAQGTIAIMHQNGNSIRLLNAEGRPVGVLNGHSKPLTGLCWNREGTLLVSCALDKTVRAWDIGRKVQIWSQVLSAYPSAVSQSALSVVAVGTLKGDIYLMNSAGKDRSRLTGHQYAVVSVSFSADGSRLLSGSEDLKINLWDMKKRELLKSLAGHSGLVEAATFIDNSTGLSSDTEGQVLLWDFETGSATPVFKTETQVGAVAVSKDYYFIGDSTGKIYLVKRDFNVFPTCTPLF